MDIRKIKSEYASCAECGATFIEMWELEFNDYNNVYLCNECVYECLKVFKKIKKNEPKPSKGN
jgi:hypothetical protein